jgi:hypothetical protein
MFQTTDFFDGTVLSIINKFIKYTKLRKKSRMVPRGFWNMPSDNCPTKKKGAPPKRTPSFRFTFTQSSALKTEIKELSLLEFHAI